MFDFKFRTLIELTETFSDEQKCIDFLEQILWNGNPVSPFDPTSKVYKCKNNRYRCKNTGKTSMSRQELYSRIQKYRSKIGS